MTECQYFGCDESAAGTLDIVCGERSYCATHYAVMVRVLDGDITVVDAPE